MFAKLNNYNLNTSRLDLSSKTKITLNLAPKPISLNTF